MHCYLAHCEIRRLDSGPVQARNEWCEVEDGSSRGDAERGRWAPAKPTTDGLRAAAAATYSRYLKTSWIDPINITISSQTVALQWSGTA